MLLNAGFGKMLCPCEIMVYDFGKNRKKPKSGQIYPENCNCNTKLAARIDLDFLSLLLTILKLDFQCNTEYCVFTMKSGMINAQLFVEVSYRE